MPNDKQKIGGKLINTGSKSCILKPNLPCKNSNESPNDKKISKIVFGEKSKEYTENETKINHIIKEIPGYKDWSLVFDKMCKPPLFDEAKKIDKGLYDCIGDPSVEESTVKLKGNLNTKKRDLFNKHSIMLVGDYGGVTLDAYFEKLMNDSEDFDPILFDYKFLVLMDKLKYIFIGLHVMRDNKISHLDVKPDNIILDEKYFKFIDFGISAEYKNLKHFRRRANIESKSTRLYLWYPAEFLFSQESKQSLTSIKQIINKDYDNFKTNSVEYKEIQRDSFSFSNQVGSRDGELHLKKLIDKYLSKSWDIDFEHMIKDIDVYSLGMIIPYLFYKNNLLYRIKDSKILIRFFSLFDFMTRYYFKNRIHIGEARILYEGLLNKYYIKDYTTFKKKTSILRKKWVLLQRKLDKKGLNKKYKEIKRKKKTIKLNKNSDKNLNKKKTKKKSKFSKKK